MLRTALRFIALVGLPLLSVAAADLDNAIETHTMLIRPAQEPRPGTFLLTYEGSELREGNAAIDLYKAMIVAAERKTDPQELDRFDQLTPEKVAEIAGQHQETYRYLDYAARCRSCDWQIPWRDQSPFAIVLPELMQVRALQRLLMVKCRYELHQGNVAEAVRTLRISFGIVRHTATGPTLIHGLVAASMAQQAREQMEHVIQHPDCPSLYWSLASLPTPLIDLRPAIKFEAAAIEMQFPVIRRLRDETLPTEEAMRLSAELAAQVQTLLKPQEGQEQLAKAKQFLATIAASAEVPAARKRLQGEGYDAAQLERTAAPQVLILDSYLLYRRQFAAMSHWFDLPLTEALPRHAEMARGWETPPNLTPLHVFQTVVPAVTRARLSAARIDRQRAGLMAVEAIRLYVTSHGGALPEKLDQLAEAPAPNDPFTGRPFEYTCEGPSARLTAPPLKDESLGKSYAWQYDLKRAAK